MILLSSSSTLIADRFLRFCQPGLSLMFIVWPCFCSIEIFIVICLGLSFSVSLSTILICLSSLSQLTDFFLHLSIDLSKICSQLFSFQILIFMLTLPILLFCSSSNSVPSQQQVLLN